MPGHFKTFFPLLTLEKSKYLNLNFVFYSEPSNFRSGSSFTGELLSALPSAAYYYEPLYSLR